MRPGEPELIGRGIDSLQRLLAVSEYAAYRQGLAALGPRLASGGGCQCHAHRRWMVAWPGPRAGRLAFICTGGLGCSEAGFGG